MVGPPGSVPAAAFSAGSGLTPAQLAAMQAMALGQFNPMMANAMLGQFSTAAAAAAASATPSDAGTGTSLSLVLDKMDKLTALDYERAPYWQTRRDEYARGAMAYRTSINAPSVDTYEDDPFPEDGRPDSDAPF